MSPQQFIAKREIIAGNALCPPPLKINKDSHFIRKSSSPPPPNSSPSSPSLLINGGAGTTKPSPQHHPVIIYTQSPKIIHTHPRDFMALVQKLTGLSRSDDEPSPKGMKSGEENRRSKTVMRDDNESSVFAKVENCCGVVEGQVNSCFAPPMFEKPPPPPPQLANSYLSSIPVYRPHSTDKFFCSNQPFFNYGDTLFFGAPNIHSISSASANSTLNGMNDFCDYNEY